MGRVAHPRERTAAPPERPDTRTGEARLRPSLTVGLFPTASIEISPIIRLEKSYLCNFQCTHCSAEYYMDRHLEKVLKTNEHRPLALQQSFELPAWMAGARCAEVTRLAVTQRADSRLVKTVMLKAAYCWCERAGVRYVLVTARSPLDRQYARLMFRDVDPAKGFVPLEHVFGLPHRVMYCDIATARFEGAGHPLYDFWFNTDHPDIELDAGDGGTVG